jgi:hypothetical protein
LIDEGWRATGGRGEIFFDAPSNSLIVRQHQEAQVRIHRLLADLSTPVDAPPDPAAPEPPVPAAEQ